MVSLSGLSAVYPGYQTAEKSSAQTELLRQEAAATQLDREGEMALGRTFQALVPGAQPIGGGPQAPQAPQAPAPPAMSRPMSGGPAPTPPMPGQPSVPMQQSGPPGGFNDRFRQADTGQIPQVDVSGVQPPQPRVAGPPGIPQPEQQFDLNTAATAIAKANPGIRPEVLVHALSKAMPYLNSQAQMQVKQLMLEQREFLASQREAGLDRRTEQRGETQKDIADKRVGAQRDIAETRAGVQREVEEGRKSRFERSETRREAAQAWRQDAKFQELELRRKALEDRAKAVTNREEAARLGAEIRTLHNKTMEYLQTNSMLNTLGSVEKRAVGEQVNSQYQAILDRLRTKTGASTPGRAGPEGEPTAPVKSKDQQHAPSNTLRPPGELEGGAANPRAVKTQTITKPKPPPADVLLQFNDALKAGKPREALIKRLQEQGYSTEGL